MCDDAGCREAAFADEDLLHAWPVSYLSVHAGRVPPPSRLSHHDHIIIADLRVNCIVGIRPPERITPQEVVISVEVATDTRRAARSHLVEETVDYSALSASIRTVVIEGRFELIETMAEEIAALVLDMPLARKVRVLVKKPAGVADAAYAAVDINRPAGQ